MCYCKGDSRGPRRDSTPADIAFFTYVPKATRSSTVIFRAVDYNFIGLHETSVGNVSDEKPKLAPQRDNPCGLGLQNTKHAFIIGTVHPTRCTALESLGGFYSSHGWVPPQLSQIYKQVHLLPEMQTLAIHLKDAYFEDYDRVLNNDPRYYTSWAMPNLRQFTFENFIPRGSLLRTVTSVTGLIRPYGFIDSPDKLLSFLRENSQIRNLKLVLEDCDFDDTESQHVVLEEVESLEISWLSNGSHHEHLGQLMRHLSFPNLVTFKVSLNEAETWSVVDGWLESLFAGQERFEKVPYGFYLSTIPKSRRSNVESPTMWRWSKLLEYCR